MYIPAENAVISSTPFSNYVKHVRGGTEYMASELIERFGSKLDNFKNYKTFVIPGEAPRDMEYLMTEPNIIVWLHNTLDQFNEQVDELFKNQRFLDNIKYLVVVSEFHKELTLKQCAIDPKKVVVIQNAIEPVKFNKDKFNNVDKVKIIHASSPDRGMEVLLRAITQIEDDFELNIFNTFNPDVDPITPAMKELLESDSRINFYGKTPRQTVLKYFSDAHIHAYPSVWLETSCLVQIEALSAGCYSVYSDIGSLKETSMGHGKMIKVGNDIDKYAETFAKELSKAIKSVKEGKLKIDPVKQSEEVSSFFSWQKAEERWMDLNGKL
jgi:UDP-glucose:(glucosyl)LPS alpha-1,2-glucosyltransferase